MLEDYIERLKKLADDLAEKSFSDTDISRIKYYLVNITKRLDDNSLINFVNKEYDIKGAEQKRRSFNGLTAKEWAVFSRSVWNDVSSTRAGHHLDHGATYPKALSDRIIRMYSKEGDLVFDPFLGTGTTLISAKEMNRLGVGIELNKDFYEASKKVILDTKSLFEEDCDIKIYNDDCRNLGHYLENNSVQLTFTSPPYADFIRKSVKDRASVHKKSLIRMENNSTVKPYSDCELDFGNLDYESFMKETQSLMEKIYAKTKDGGYNIWVVKDCRDTSRKIPYIDFHSDVAKAAERAGFKYHDLIIWDQNERRKLILLGYPSVFYVNQNNSFLVVLRKCK